MPRTHEGERERRPWHCVLEPPPTAAAHLVDHVIPHVPVRQRVLSLPVPLRVLQADVGCGSAVTLIQHFGSSANSKAQPQ